MNGIVAACQGKLGADSEFRITSGGSAMLSCRVAVTEQRKDGQASEVQWVSFSVFGDRAAELHEGGRLTRGVEVYAEGKLRQNTWADQDGQQHTGMQLSAWVLQPIGQVGRRSAEPRTNDRVYRGGLGATAGVSPRPGAAHYPQHPAPAAAPPQVRTPDDHDDRPPW